MPDVAGSGAASFSVTATGRSPVLFAMTNSLAVSLAQNAGLEIGVDVSGTIAGNSYQEASQGINLRQRFRFRTGYLATGRYRR